MVVLGGGLFIMSEVPLYWVGGGACPAAERKTRERDRLQELLSVEGHTYQSRADHLIWASI